VIDLVILIVLIITITSTYATLRIGKKIGNNSKSLKKGTFLTQLLNYLPALLVLPTYIYYILGYIKLGFILKSPPNIYFFISGIVLLCFSLILYSDSILHMGKMWTIGLELRKGHKVVKSHAYKYIRHPIYMAWFCIIISSAMLLQNIFILVYLVPVFIWYNIRANLEENFLLKNLKGYSVYYHKSKKYIPFIY